jgi:DNA-binding response OmpR family regulator
MHAAGLKPGTRILIVEDDRSISRLLELELGHRGIDARPVTDGLAALDAVASFRPQAIILDILLPGMDGETILGRLRRQGDRTPVIMLTARDRSSDKIRNLDTGADDYLTKPFDIDELLARLRAVLRRVEPDDIVRVGGLEVNTTLREVRHEDAVVTLTAREYDVLEYLARNARHVLSRDAILDAVWREHPDVDPNVVDVYIGYLRRKLDGAGAPRLIQTVRGVGFTLREV